MNKENWFLKFITFSPLIFIPVIIGSISFIFINNYNETIQSNFKKIEQDLYANESQAIKSKILNISDIFEYQKSVIKEDLKNRVKERVYMAYGIANDIYEENKSKKSEKNIIKDIHTALKSLIWNNGESFIWMLDYDGIFKLAPEYLTHLEGSSLINFQDAKGRYVIQEEIAICKSQVEGFLWDTFTKPNEHTNIQYEQVAFVKSFGHFNLYLGSSEYLDTATKSTNKNLLNSLEQINKLSDNYTFVIDMKGNILANQSIPQYVGKNISEIDDNLTKSLVSHITNTVSNKKSDFTSYKWINPMTNEVEKKYVFVQKIPDSDWIIGSGFYLSNIEKKIEEQTTQIQDKMYNKLNKIIYFSIGILFISLFVSYFITKTLKNSFLRYRKHIGSQKDELQILNETLEVKVEKRTNELQALKDEFEKLATTDALTKLNNRYYLMKLFQSEISRSNRYNTPLSVIMLDIDHFKEVNDTYGHDIGDKVLSLLAELMNKSLRDIDIAGRYGGEEFLIILPNTVLEDAKLIAERFRVKVAKFPFETVGQITVSIGLVEFVVEEKIDEVFKRVDEKLYESKNNGRNQVSS